MSCQTYDVLRRTLVEEFGRFDGSNVALDALKTKYATAISSKRRLELILTLEDLLNILEKRNCLSPANFQVCNEINARLNSQRVSELLKQLSPRERKPSKIRTVNEIVVKEIGQKYRELGRCVGISNADIEIIDVQYPTDVRSRIWKILETVESEKIDDRDYYEKLCNCLRECGRNDIRKKVLFVLNS